MENNDKKIAAAALLVCAGGIIGAGHRDDIRYDRAKHVPGGIIVGGNHARGIRGDGATGGGTGIGGSGHPITAIDKVGDGNITAARGIAAGKRSNHRGETHIHVIGEMPGLDAGIAAGEPGQTANHPVRPDIDRATGTGKDVAANVGVTGVEQPWLTGISGNIAIILVFGGIIFAIGAEVLVAGIKTIRRHIVPMHIHAVFGDHAHGEEGAATGGDTHRAIDFPGARVGWAKGT